MSLLGERKHCANPIRNPAKSQKSHFPKHYIAGKIKNIVEMRYHPIHSRCKRSHSLSHITLSVWFAIFPSPYRTKERRHTFAHNRKIYEWNSPIIGWTPQIGVIGASKPVPNLENYNVLRIWLKTSLKPQKSIFLCAHLDLAQCTNTVRTPRIRWEVQILFHWAFGRFCLYRIIDKRCVVFI